MTDPPSTLRPGNGSTLGEVPLADDLTALERLVAEEWQQAQSADLVAAIERHPEVLQNRSVLLNLAIREYRSYRANSDSFELERHCERFRPFGTSVEQSIFRQLDTQQYLDDHPELFDYLAITEWPEVGDDFGDFKLLEQLGSGASARVYLAKQGDLGDRLVVIKATPYSSFEASILGRLNHPHIVPIHYAGKIDESHLSFLCMPYCGRSTLVDLVDMAFAEGLPTRSGVIQQAALRWLPPAEREAVARDQRSRKPGPPTYIGAILKLARQMADALDHAHQRGILHGDLKPSNVLLTPGGEPLLLDFNLSRDESTGPVLLGGTLAYMPPEQLKAIAGEELERDSRGVSAAAADIYSFAALLYELLAGHPPLPLGESRDAPEVAARNLLDKLKSPLPAICELNPEVSKRFSKLIMQCLAVDPRERPKSMGEVKRRLGAEAHWGKEARRVARLHPRMVGAVALLSIASLTAATSWYASRPSAHVSYFQQGLAAAQQSDWQTAERWFLKAIQLAPDYEAAQLELGRTYLAANQLDLALSTLEKLSVEQESNPQLMELVGYIYNLKLIPTAAIAWYERSLEYGGESLSLYNNLAASYLTGLPKQSASSRLELQAHYLELAVATDPTALAVRANLLRHHLAMAVNDSAYDLKQAEELADQLSKQSRSHPSLERLIDAWRVVALSKPDVTPPRESEQQSVQPYAEVHENDFETFYIKPKLAP